MKMYSAHGVNDFIVCCGYRGYMIKEYFANYSLHMADVTFDLGKGTVEISNRPAEPWRVTIIDTGEGTLTGGRLKRVESYLNSESAFCMTYGDGLADIDISATITFHEQHERLATVTAVKPPGRFGGLAHAGVAHRRPARHVGRSAFFGGLTLKKKYFRVRKT